MACDDTGAAAVLLELFGQQLCGLLEDLDLLLLELGPLLLLLQFLRVLLLELLDLAGLPGQNFLQRLSRSCRRRLGSRGRSSRSRFHLTCGGRLGNLSVRGQQGPVPAPAPVRRRTPACTRSAPD